MPADGHRGSPRCEFVLCAYRVKTKLQFQNTQGLMPINGRCLTVTTCGLLA